MRLSERDIKTNINSEIHASLRRLEDANYTSEVVQDEKLSTLGDQLESKIGKLQNEVYQLHSYLETHIYNDDLQFFQTIYIGNLQVAEGGEINGNLLINNGGTLTVDGSIMANTGVDIYGDAGLFTPKITMGDESEYTSHTLSVCGTVITGKILATQDLSVLSTYAPHTLTVGNATSSARVLATQDLSIYASYAPHTLSVEGTTLSGRILANQDMSFSLVGLVEGNGSGDVYTIRTKTNHVGLMDIVVVPLIEYNSTTHKYRSWTQLKDRQGNVLLTSSSKWSGTEAYDAGGSGGTTYSNSAVLEWFETVDNIPRFKKTSGDWIGYSPTTVHW